MKKDEIIRLYIGDLQSKVKQSPARDNRIKMLEKELELVNKNSILPDVINCAFKVGENVIVFNDTRWRKTGDLKEGNDIYFQKAKILRLRYNKEWLADVEFKSGQISNGHFVRGIKHCL